MWEPLTSLARRRNQLRVERLTKSTNALRQKKERTEAESRRLNTAFGKLIDYPTRLSADRSVEYYADSATRLGNIIATYELYAETRYGVDGVFFWFHLLSLAPESLRKEFGEQYSFSESLVLASASGALIALLHALTLIASGARLVCPRIPAFTHIASTTSVAFIMSGILIWISFYLASLSAHREAGKMLRSIIDNAMPSFIKWLTEFAAPIQGGNVSKLEKIRRYLAEPSDSNKVSE